jgi:hypothetical protein
MAFGHKFASETERKATYKVSTSLRFARVIAPAG